MTNTNVMWLVVNCSDIAGTAGDAINPSARETSTMTTTQINKPEWQALEKARVVFGHQSVGRKYP